MMIEVLNVNLPTQGKINAMTTLRSGGESINNYSSFNPAQHVGDDEKAVDSNREKLYQQQNLPSHPHWLNQVHGTKIIQLNDKAISNQPTITADGSYTLKKDVVCVVMTADCLPVFLADRDASVVGVIHAGWRGLASGILSKAVAKLNQQAQEICAAIGPGIGPEAYEVSEEMKAIFYALDENTKTCFHPSHNQGHYFANLYQLAKLQLAQSGVKEIITFENRCTFKQNNDFFSYRRDGQCGRMASLIWMPS